MLQPTAPTAVLSQQRELLDSSSIVLHRPPYYRTIDSIDQVFQSQIRILSALLDGEISILVAFATKIVKQHP
jgi:hypothetical protein